jgi:hypothetical protein
VQPEGRIVLSRGHRHAITVVPDYLLQTLLPPEPLQHLFDPLHLLRVSLTHTHLPLVLQLGEEALQVVLGLDEGGGGGRVEGEVGGEGQGRVEGRGEARVGREEVGGEGGEVGGEGSVESGWGPGGPVKGGEGGGAGMQGSQMLLGEGLGGWGHQAWQEVHMLQGTDRLEDHHS